MWGRKNLLKPECSFLAFRTRRDNYICNMMKREPMSGVSESFYSDFFVSLLFEINVRFHSVKIFEINLVLVFG